MEDEGRESGVPGPWVWSAYKAYNELLRDKIKKKFDAQEGPWMDELAGYLVEFVNARWEGGRKGDKAQTEILQKIRKHLDS